MDEGFAVRMEWPILICCRGVLYLSVPIKSRRVCLLPYARACEVEEWGFGSRGASYRYATFCDMLVKETEIGS